MNLVIEIDDGLYNQILSDAEIMIYGGMRCGKTLLATLLRAIRNGTPIEDYCKSQWKERSLKCK